jgi:hypothetical protein
MKLRAIVNGVSFYTNTTAIRKRKVSDFGMINDALHYALELKGNNSGIGTTIRYYDHQMKQHKFDIQLSEV